MFTVAANEVTPRDSDDDGHVTRAAARSRSADLGMIRAPHFCLWVSHLRYCYAQIEI